MTAPHTYITTTIPYVNARPHIGFALELVQAGVLARYRRGRGKAVRFQAGTDDNSLKNVLAAQAGGEDLDAALRQVSDLVGAALHEFDFRQATAAVWAIADEANRFINRVRPWEQAAAERGDDVPARLHAVLYLLVRACSAIGRELAPFLPDAAARITSQCTPRDGRLPAPSPVFRRLAPAR